MSTAVIVDWDAVLTVVWASLAAGVGVSAAYGLAILGGTRAADFRRDGRAGEAALFAALGLIGLALVAGAIAAGIVALTE
jgi:hypothetical protein